MHTSTEMSIPEAQLQRETLIGRGLTSEVFSWGQDRVLKLCLPWRPLTDVQREFAATQAFTPQVCLRPRPSSWW